MADSALWNQQYEDGTTPWDVGVPEPWLIQAIERGVLPPGRALELGCGTGTNARLLARMGWRVTAMDFAPRALQLARDQGGDVTYQVHDVLAGPPPGGPYDAVFDRGCFHVFHEDEERARFAGHVADALRPGGVWLSLIGSTEGPPRDAGPPRRSALEIVQAVEPALEITSLTRTSFVTHPYLPAAWLATFRKRTEPAQPSSRPR